jgi:hypothetical protein
VPYCRKMDKSYNFQRFFITEKSRRISEGAIRFKHIKGMKWFDFVISKCYILSYKVVEI